jgi:DNA-binding NtrC family response regulator
MRCRPQPTTPRGPIRLGLKKMSFIIDDEVDIREVLAGILEDKGYTLDLASSVAEAKR